MSINLKELVYLFGSIFLLGCGGTDSDNSSSNLVSDGSGTSAIPMKIRAVSTTKGAMLGAETQVTVNANSYNGQALQISKVTPRRNDDCTVTNISGLTYTFTNSAVGECVFDYEVKPVSAFYSGSVTSSTRVAVSSTFDRYELPILSRTTYIGSPLTIDLKFSLDSDFPIDSADPYQLDVDNIAIHGAADVVITVGSDLTNPTITISPTDESQAGVTRVAYSLKNNSNTKLGVIDFTVSYSDGLNRKPVANNYILKDYISLNEFDLDLSTLTNENGDPLISDADGDSLTLVETSNYNVSSPQTSSTLIFSLKPQRSGTNYIPYTVTDGHGGYATGLIQVTVAPDFSTINQSWNDITIDKGTANEVTFSAPLTITVADMLYVDYNGNYSESGITGPKATTVMTSSYELAQDYCRFRQGRLPTTAEMERLIASRNGSLYNNDNWPTGVEFWAADMSNIDTPYTYNMHIGQQNVANRNESRYVTCVYLTDTTQPYRVEFEKLREPTDNYNDTYAHGLNDYGYIRAIIYDPYGDVAPYQPVTFSSISGGPYYVSNMSSPNSFVNDISMSATEGGRFEFVIGNQMLTNNVVNLLAHHSTNLDGDIIGQYVYYSDDEGETNEPLYLDIYSNDKWHWYKYEVAKYGNIDERGGIGNGIFYDNSAAKMKALDQQGLKLWDETNYDGSYGAWIPSKSYKMWAFYILKQPFIGKNFSAKLVFMHRDYEGRNSSLDTMDASVTFSLQQKWTNMSIAPSGQAAQDILGAPTSYHYQNGNHNQNEPIYKNNEKVLPGVGISDDRALTIQMRRKYNDANNIYFSVLNTRDDMVLDSNNNNLGTKGQLEVVWIDYVKGELSIYSAAAREVNDAHMMEKPSTPVLYSTNTTLGSIDPSKPYYLMMSQYIYVSDDVARRDTAFLFALSFQSWE